MERVEILKGPQGTLFGRNATGGLVHYVTKKPSDEFEAYGDVSYGRYDSTRFEGAVGGPLSDGVKFRIAGFYRRHDAILKNVYTPEDLPATPAYVAVPFTPNGGPPRPPLNGSRDGQADMWRDDQYAFRGQLLFEPNEDLEIELKGQYAHRNPASGHYQNVATISEVDAQGASGQHLVFQCPDQSQFLRAISGWHHPVRVLLRPRPQWLASGSGF